MSDQRQYSENPDIQWALDLLKPDPTYKLSVMQMYTTEIVCVGSGFAFGCVKNLVYRRPTLAGIQVHIGFAIGGYVLSQIVNKVIDDYKAERDTRLRSYIMMHPELFPKPVRVKNSDILKPWTPIR